MNYCSREASVQICINTIQLASKLCVGFKREIKRLNVYKKSCLYKAKEEQKMAVKKIALEIDRNLKSQQSQTIGLCLAKISSGLAPDDPMTTWL